MSGDMYEVVAVANDTQSWIYRDRLGMVSLLGTSACSDDFVGIWDGTNLVYEGKGCSGSAQLYLGVFSGGAEQLLGPLGQSAAQAGLRGYAAKNGWVAYSAPINGVDQAWVRSPDAGLLQVSIWNTNSVVESVSAGGEVMLSNPWAPRSVPSRYLGVPSAAAPQAVGSDLGIAVPACDGWYVMMGDTLFRVLGGEDAGAACPGVSSTGGAGQDAETEATVFSADVGADATLALDGASIDAPAPADGGLVDESASANGPASDAAALQQDAAVGPGSDAGLARDGEVGSGSGGSASGGGGCAVASLKGHPASCWFIAAIAGGLARRRSRQRRGVGCSQSRTPASSA